MAPKYRWIILRDVLDEGTPDYDRKGLAGPGGYDPSIVDNKSTFELYDDDKELYYTGELFGDYHGFEPLEDFGIGYASCTMMKLNGKWL